MNFPLPELYSTPEPSDFEDEFISWEGDSCKILTNKTWNKLFDKLDVECTEEEDEETIKQLNLKVPHRDLYKSIEEEVVWTRPSNLEITKNYIVRSLDWRERTDYPVNPNAEWIRTIEVLCQKLTAEETDELVKDEKIINLLLWLQEKTEK